MSETLTRLALVASPTDRAQEAAAELRASRDWVDLEQADGVVALGGDGFMLQILHQMLDAGRILPVYGINLGTVGFLMNRLKSSRTLDERIARARRIAVSPLWMEATTNSGDVLTSWAINEVSLLRETRQTAKLEVTVNGKVRIPELSCDGILVATPAGSTAYNLSANGPILPLGSNMLALTPISPFRPRRWRGAILPETAEIVFRARESDQTPGAGRGRPDRSARRARSARARLARTSADLAVRQGQEPGRTHFRRTVHGVIFCDRPSAIWVLAKPQTPVISALLPRATGPFPDSSAVELSTVNRVVVGSNPTQGAIFFGNVPLKQRLAAGCR